MRAGLAIACSLPVVSLLAIEVYVRGFDGWGAWATAPLFLLPLALSVVIGIGAAARCVSEGREGTLRVSSLALTVVALVPVLWILVRRHVT